MKKKFDRRVIVHVHRSQWGCGPNSKGLLYDKASGLLCCLGFACEAMGVPRCRLGVDLPGSLEGRDAEAVRRLVNQLEWVYTAADTNDRPVEAMPMIEEQLLKHCERPDAPVLFRFVD